MFFVPFTNEPKYLKEAFGLPECTSDEELYFYLYPTQDPEKMREEAGLAPDATWQELVRSLNKPWQ